MNLSNVCAISDTYYIAENKLELNQEYLSSSELIYTDGNYNSHINKDGYIKIFDVYDANYLVFIDESGNLFLAVYKFIADIKFKDIINAINDIREQTGMHKHDKSANKKEDEVSESIDELVDINNMTCDVCGSEDFVEPFKYDKDRNITCQCKGCNTIYKLSPSKYYAIKSKTIFSNANDILITREVTNYESE